MKIYYAHCIAIYNTPQESRDITTLAALGFEPVNPNHPDNEAGYKQHGMEYFRRFVFECDAVAFRALPDGTIPAGVATEVGWFRDEGRPIIELPSAFSRRTLTVDETREHIKEAGKR